MVIPIDGVVLSRAVDEGQTVAAGFSTPTLFTIANDLRKMRVIADVDEADIGEVQEGQYVTFTVDAYPEDMFEGSVIQIRLLATTTSNVVTYEVVIDAPNEDLKLKPGLTAEVNIYILNKENIITVPLRALRFVPEGYTVPDSGSHVFVMNPDGTLSARAVSTGVSDGIYSEITYGLKQGEQVVSGLKAAGKLSAENGNAAATTAAATVLYASQARTGRQYTYQITTTGMNEIIKVEDLKRDFVVGEETVHALRDLSFTIAEGEFVTIMGTSGSGKSTLLNILGCLDIPTGGEYYLDGVPVRKMGKNDRALLRNRKIGFVFQSYNLLPKTTALENVELPLLYNKTVNAAQRKEKSQKALESVGLADRVNHRSNQMSGGQQQRVAIARALVNDPVIILADEATGNLDTRTSFEILTLFQDFHAQGRTILFVTHNHEIARYGSRNIVLRDGRVIEDTRNKNIASAKDTLASLPAEEEE